MSPPATLLKVLQLGDSFFPSGANVFSYGLEGLREQGRLLHADDVERLVEGQLAHRWADGERVALLHAYAAAGDLDAVQRVDQLVEASSLVESWRLGGRRLGRSLLRTHRALGTEGAAAYDERVRAVRAPGQASAVHGLVAFASGLSGDEAATLSAYGLIIGLVSAALRLGVLSHLDGQRIVGRQLERVSALVALPVPPLAALATWVPHAEIASMRQEARRGRLFAT